MNLTPETYGQKVHNGRSKYDYFIPFGPGKDKDYVRGAWFKDDKIVLSGDVFSSTWYYLEKCSKSDSDQQEEILAEISLEREQQDQKWGVQRHDPYKWLVILGEEVGEANKAAFEAEGPKFGDIRVFDEIKLEEYRKELVQVAAVAVAAIEALDATK